MPLATIDTGSLRTGAVGETDTVGGAAERTRAQGCWPEENKRYAVMFAFADNAHVSLAPCMVGKRQHTAMKSC